jgi:PAP2 superfamily/Vanadium chloroperoxidase N-terminal domain
MKLTRRLQFLGTLAMVPAFAIPYALQAQAAPTASNAVRDWNATALAVIAADKQDPAMSLRTLTMMHLAIYDALQAIASGSSGHPYTFAGATLNDVPGGASHETATASAARTVLLGLDPTQRPTIDAAFAASMGSSSASPAGAQGTLVGAWVGTHMLTSRTWDGSNLAVDYIQPANLGIYQSVPPVKTLGTNVRNITPFMLLSASQFRPGPPPALNSAQYAADYNEVKSLGAVNSTTRTQDQTEAALFWVEDDSYTWNTVARAVATKRGTTLEQDAALFAELNVAMADAQIAVFDAKFTYNFWRPVAAIQAGNVDGNPNTVGDTSWAPLRFTPPFPDYPAAHPTNGGAASTVLASIFGDGTGFSVATRTASNGARSYTSFSQAANEEASARVYLGVHFRTAVNAGLTLGKQVGDWTISHFGATR